jgi:HSP20 family protein
MVNRLSMQPISRLRDEMDRLMANWFDGAEGFLGDGGRGFPALNVWEDQDHVYIEAELPGLKVDELEISVVGDLLTLKGQRSEFSPKGATFHRRERGVGDFSRVLRLPVMVESDQVQANLRDGVLLVTLPKAPEAKPRKIAVSATD